MIGIPRNLSLPGAFLGAILAAAPARALEVQVSFPPGGGEARILVRHVSAVEPLGALRLKLRFKESAGAGALAVFSAASGPWSQIRPELRRDGRIAEVLALAPTVGESRGTEPVTVAELAVPLAGVGAPSAALSAEDLVDSVWVAEALDPFGGKSEVAHRVTTAIGKARSPRTAPKEIVVGSRRTLSFALAKEGRVVVRVLDARGRTAVTVFDGRKGKGMHEIVWDGMGRGGRDLPAGTYFLRLEAGTFAYDRKLEVLP